MTRSTDAAKARHVEAREATSGFGDVSALVRFVVALADDALVLGHRLSQWSGQAPMLEEDIALSNLALDLIGQARLLYSYAGEIEDAGRSEDDFAYLRDEHAFRNILLVEQPNGDFAATMVRQFLYAAFLHPYYQALAGSRDARLAEIAAKAVKEMAYHVRHSAEWVIRLGDGTEESHARAAAALDELWTFTGELFELQQEERVLAANGIAVGPGGDPTKVARDARKRAGPGNTAVPCRSMDADRRPHGPSWRTPRAYAGRNAGASPRASGGDVVVLPS